MDRAPDGPPVSLRPAPPANPDDVAVTAADAPHGRIGYGRLARFTPLLLAALLIVALGAIGWVQRDREPALASPADLVGQAAPDVAITLLDGTTLRLADLRGSVVVLNFWASWCPPCQEEAPLLQQLHVQSARSEPPVTVVGVGARLDWTDRAAAFARDLGLTYTLGRDTATDQPGGGPAEQAFNVAQYPSTVFIHPDGTIASFVLGALDEEQLDAAVADARQTPS